MAFYGPRKDSSWGELRESTGTTDEGAARRILADRVREAANHRDGIKTFAPTAAAKLTVHDLCDALESDLRARGIKSLTATLLHLKWPRESLGGLKAQAVKAETVRRYVAQRKALGRANATINRETELLSSAFRLAVREETLTRMPPFPPALPEDNARQGFFEADEIDRLVVVLPTPLADMTLLAFRTGWRRDELRLLRWADVDAGTREIRLTTSKNGRPRVVTLDEEDWEILDRMAGRRVFDESHLSLWVFHRNGLPINRSVMRRQWNKGCEAVGLFGRIFHDLRRSAVRNMVHGGVPPSTAMEISGHKTQSMLARYAIVSQGNIVDALRRSREFATRSRSSSNVVGIGSKGGPR
ncbi:MAG: site-specific integrase [Acidobacteriota bacterium]